MSSIGKGYERTDVIGKVTGKAKYTGDMHVPNMLYAKMVRSTIAHGIVKNIDKSKAEEMPGVVAVLTADDLPNNNKFQPAGMPIASYPEHADGPDKTILTKKVRFYGDEIAAVVAVDQLTAKKALSLIEVEYEELPVYLDPVDSLKENAIEIHEGSKNIYGQCIYTTGDEDLENAYKQCDRIFDGEYKVNPVQHCHLENQISYAYLDEKGKMVIVTSTQIPFICKRMVSHALDWPMGKLRIVKPYVGGGFGNKTDVITEVIVAALTIAVGGRPVMLEYTREEVMCATRTRHGVSFKIRTGVNNEGRILAKEMLAISNTGAYGSHGNCVTAGMGSGFLDTYPAELGAKFEGITAYTNIAVAGAMRAYGMPQVNFAMESQLDEIAEELGLDPIEIREKNIIKVGDLYPSEYGAPLNTCAFPECFSRLKEVSDWDKKRKQYSVENTGDKRKGIGMASFIFHSGTAPWDLECAGARMTLNQDGSLLVLVGATEIGQGSETVFTQIAAEATGILFEKVYVEQSTDTDISPFDLGAYATRQTYISGQAVLKAGKEIHEKILSYASDETGINQSELVVVDGQVVRIVENEPVVSVEEIAMKSYYTKTTKGYITTDAFVNINDIAITVGATVAEVEVDIKTGQVEILDICNIMDCGTVLNPSLASGQVHGGMGQSIGMALTEIMLFDAKGRLLNDNLLDYKVPTIMDTPELGVEFIETYEPTGPYGAKGLGEPPTVTPSQAIRNAVFHATGVRVNELPMNPQKLFERFSEEGLI
jgi:xanthine dehydrogenase molybdenum-binding subunit